MMDKRERRRIYYEENWEKIQEYKRQYREKNKRRMNQQARDRYRDYVKPLTIFHGIFIIDIN